MKENDETDYERKLNIIIEERLSKMERPEYKFAKRFSKRDYFFTAAVAVVCPAFVLMSAFIN